MTTTTMTTTTTTTTTARAGFSSVMRRGASSKTIENGFSPSRSGTKSTFLSSSSAFTSSSSFGRRKNDKSGSRQDFFVRDCPADAFNNLSSTLDKRGRRWKAWLIYLRKYQSAFERREKSLVEADVSLPVVRRFIKRVEEDTGRESDQAWNKARNS